MAKEYSYNIKTLKTINKWFDSVKYILMDFDYLMHSNHDEYMGFVSTIKKIKNLGSPLFAKKAYHDFYERYTPFIVDLGDSVYSFFEDAFENIHGLFEYYDYCDEHIEQIEQIDELLNKIESLGISTVVYSPRERFEEEHSIYLNNHYFEYLHFLDRIEVIPSYNYGSSEVKYKGISSNYELPLRVDKDKGIHCYHTIKVNNFIFSPDLLPSELTFEETIGKIVKSKEEKDKESEVITDFVRLRVGTSDLKDALIELQRKVAYLHTIKEYEKYDELLSQISSTIDEVDEYTTSLINKNEYITEEQIEEQSDSYVRYRKTSKWNIE